MWVLFLLDVKKQKMKPVGLNIETLALSDIIIIMLYHYVNYSVLRSLAVSIRIERVKEIRSIKLRKNKRIDNR